DDDLRIALRALEATQREDEEPAGPDLFDPIAKLLERLPARRQELPALVWPWATTDADRADVGSSLVQHLRHRPATALIPYLGDLNGWARADLVEKLAEQKKWDSATRDALFSLIGDRDGYVRERALAAIKKCEVTPEDAQRIEGLLSRKGSELRQGVLALLKKQP